MPVSDSTDTDARGLGIGILVALILLGLFHAGFIALGDEPVGERGFRGPDSYTRLVQVRQLYDSGDWYQPVFPRSNTPEGEHRVWTRAFDIPLIAGALVLAPVVGFERGLHYWGFLISPFLHALAVMALIWAAAPLLRRETLFYMAVLAPFQVSITAQFMAGRPDHHALQAVFFILLLGVMFRLVTVPPGRVLNFAAAASAALALWLSVEALIVIALLYGVLAAAWLIRGPAMAARALSISVLILLALLVIFAIERPPEQWLQEVYDRYSIVHLWIFLLVSGFWSAACLLSGRFELLQTMGRRLCGGLAGLAMISGLVWLVFPHFFGGPMVEIPPRVLTLWENNIAEFAAIIDADNLHNSLHVMLLYLGPAVPLVAYLLFVIFRARGSERQAWLVLLVAMAVYLSLAFYQLRWGIYVQLLALPVYAHALEAVLGLLARLGVSTAIAVPTRAAFRVSALLLFAVGPVALAWNIRPAPATAATERYVQFCNIKAVSKFLMRAGTYGERPRRIMSYIFDGPELLYRTRHHVVATPNHRNIDGISDTIAFFQATQPSAAKEILIRRGIDLVLICPREKETRHYRTSDYSGLLDQLAGGQAPVWLHRVELPPELSADYRLFEVVGLRP